MTPEEALSVADQVLYVHAGKRLTDIQRLILLESLAGKGYEEMQGYATQHIKNEGKELWAALSGALDEKVSKTNFRGALEKRLRSTQVIPKPPSLSAYDAKTWAGRDALIDDLLNQLHGQTRLLCLTGISGIGKTALAECLAVQFQNPDVSFHRVSFDIVGQSQDFTAGAAEILAELGDKDLDPKELNDPKRLSDRLLRKLQMHHYWLQLDALERLLNPEHPTEFTDPHWLGFFQRCLSSSDFPSRLVLTAQAIPSEFARFEDDYPHAWGEQTLRGLSKAEQLKFFGKYGVTDDSTNDALLNLIGRTYEGHPLVLRVIGGEICKDFGGNVAQYWERYGSEFEQVARELQSQRVDPALYNQTLQKRVRQRVEISLIQLPENALTLLCCSAVYRRPVVESFWLVMLDDRTPSQQQEAYNLLWDRALVEQEDICQGQLLIRQHNLIRDVAYDLLRFNPAIWKTAECKAIAQWLRAYVPEHDMLRLEKVRGYIEAFHHCCEVEEWKTAKAILLIRPDSSCEHELHWQLAIWGEYREQILLCQRILNKLDSQSDSVWLNTLGVAFWGLGNHQKSLECYQHCLVIAHKIGEHQIENAALINIGFAYNNLGCYSQAVEYLQQALTNSSETNDQSAKAYILNLLGNSYSDLNNYSKSLEYYQQCLTIACETGDQQAKSYALGNLGITYSNLGDHEKAIEFLQESLAIIYEIGDRRQESIGMCNLGDVFNSLNNHSQAIDYYQRYLEISREIGNKEGEGYALRNLGNVHNRLGQYSQAIEYYQRSLMIARGIVNPRGEGDALAGLGNAYSSLGRYSEAIDYHIKCLAIAREGDDRQREASALENLGAVYYNSGNHSQAIDYHQQHLAVARKSGDRRGEGNALNSLGNTYFGLDQYLQAIDYHQQHLAIAREVGDRRGEGVALANLGETQIKLEKYVDALKNSQAAIKIFQEINDHATEAIVFKNLAELHRRTNQIDCAFKYCEQALAIATELGIPFAEECKKLKEELEKSEKR